MKFCQKFSKNKNRPLLKNIHVEIDSPVDLIFFLINKLFYCINSDLVLTDFIPIKKCLTIIIHKT